MAREISGVKDGIGRPKKIPLKVPKKNPKAAAISWRKNTIDNNKNTAGIDRRIVNLRLNRFSSRETPVFGMGVNRHPLNQDKIG